MVITLAKQERILNKSKKQVIHMRFEAKKIRELYSEYGNIITHTDLDQVKRAMEMPSSNGMTPPVIKMPVVFGSHYGQQRTVEDTIRRLSADQLLRIGRLVCPDVPAEQHWDNRAEPHYFRNPETLRAAVCVAWRAGDYATKKKITGMLDRFGM
jgi:hypothetical protein